MIRKQKLRNNTQLKNTKGKGLLEFTYDGIKVEPHQNTFRVLIIGPSNSGKSTLFTNIIKDFPKPIKTISYLGPPSTLEDETPIKLGLILNKVGINWNPIPIEKDFIDIPNLEKPEIVVFDDLYKNKKVDSLIDACFIRGRHDKRHGVYITQSPAYVPSSVRNNYTYLILHKQFFNEDVEKKFKFLKDLLQNEWSDDLDKQFLIIKHGGIICDWYKPPEWKNTSNVISSFKTIKGGPNRFKKVNKKEEQLVKEGIKEAGNKEIDKKLKIFKTEGCKKSKIYNIEKNEDIVPTVVSSPHEIKSPLNTTNTSRFIEQFIDNFKTKSIFNI